MHAPGDFSQYSSKRMEVKFCRRQHEVLVQHLRLTLKTLGHFEELPESDSLIDVEFSSHQSSSPLPMQARRELERVLMSARSLSKDCCSELSTLKAALRQPQWSQAFADILKEIQWCTSVLYYRETCRNVEVSSIEFKTFPWEARIGYQEQFMLVKAAEEDWQQITEELENWNRGHLCTAEDCGNAHRDSRRYCLADQILQRWNERKSSHVDASSSGRADDHGHQSLLWSFDRNVLNIIRNLGSGAFGAVSEEAWLGAKYAHKRFSTTGPSSLAAEACALGKLNHPHIVQVLAYSDDSLLMQLMSTDLQNYMCSRMKGGSRTQPFSLPASIDLMLQLADAMSYLHDQKMAHRDLKSLNILVDSVDTPCLAEEGYVLAKIADFGLAKTKRDITRYSHLTRNIGTRLWMAPEIFEASKNGNHLADAFPMKADVYSFGIVCFEILSGELPFRGVPLPNLYEQLTAPVPLRPRLPSSCPTTLASLICACWEGDPRVRPAFSDVCRVLRYLKGLLMTDLNDAKLVRDGAWPFGILTRVEKQGPWGWQDQRARQVYKWEGWCRNYVPYVNLSSGSERYHVGPVADIRAIKPYYTGVSERYSGLLKGFQVRFFINGKLVEKTIGQEIAGADSDWIRFDHPSEYLVQVGGSSEKVVGAGLPFFVIPATFTVPLQINSLSFITNRQKYGPFGTAKIWNDVPFCSSPGRVVGFSGYHGTTQGINSLEVHVVPNITECLKTYLESE